MWAVIVFFLLAIVLFWAGKRISDVTWKRIVDVATILAALIGVWAFVDRSPDSNSTPTASLPITSTFFPTPSASVSFDTIPVVTENPTATKAVPTKTLISTATVKPEGVLYQADWSEGLNGWTGDGSWKVVSGMLVNDATNPALYNQNPIIAPYQPSDDQLDDYVIEAEIQLTRDIYSGGFGIYSRSGYWAGVLRDECALRDQFAFIAIFNLGSCAGDNMLFSRPLGLDNDWHIYRLEVMGNQVKLILDGAEIGSVVDNRFLEGGQIGLWSDSSSINVRSFRVYAPGGSNIPPDSSGSDPATALNAGNLFQSGDVLYQSDWSKGADGWLGDGSWKWVDGLLVNDGSNPAIFRQSPIIAPYSPGANNLQDYAVEAEMQTLSTNSFINGGYGFYMRSGYWVGLMEGECGISQLSAEITFIDLGVCGGSNMLSQRQIGMDDQWHTYRIEVFGNHIRFLIDGAEVASTVDNRFLDGGDVGLWSDNYTINVRSFLVIAP